MSKPAPDEAFRRAQALALRYLRFGTRSTAQLRAHLAARGIAGRLIDRLAVECSRKGWLDDRACAKLWATTLADRGYAHAAIRRQLAEKRLDATLIDQVLARQRSCETDDVRARALAQRSLRRTRGGGVRLRGRLARRLASRGFDAELIDRILTEFLGPPPD